MTFEVGKTNAVLEARKSHLPFVLGKRGIEGQNK
jgi:hypothetical protein